MIVAILVAVAQPSALDAERAFAADALRLGQWTAFRKWSTADALMFTPQPVLAHDFLEGRKDPPESVRWSAAESYVSCDRASAINTGPWSREAGTRFGTFTTVWRKLGNDWRWIYDAGGEEVPGPLQLDSPAKERIASCTGTPSALPEAAAPAGAKAGTGASADRTLLWSWVVMPSGARWFRAFLWNGRAYEQIVSDQVAGR